MLVVVALVPTHFDNAARIPAPDDGAGGVQYESSCPLCPLLPGTLFARSLLIMVMAVVSTKRIVIGRCLAFGFTEKGSNRYGRNSTLRSYDN